MSMINLIVILLHVYCCEAVNEPFCMDQLNTSRAINDVWRFKKCICRCLSEDNKPTISCKNCRGSSAELPVRLYIYPDCRLFPMGIKPNYRCVIDPIEYTPFYPNVTTLWCKYINRYFACLPPYPDFFTGEMMDDVEVQCHQRNLTLFTRRLEYYPLPPVIYTFPHYTDLYFKGEVMNFSCCFYPDLTFGGSFCNLPYIVDFSIYNYTFNYSFVVDRDIGTICYSCAHPFLNDPVRSCYEPTGYNNHTVSIEPSDIDFYMPNRPMNVVCTLTPDTLLKTGRLRFSIMKSQIDPYNEETEDNLYSLLFKTNDVGSICYTCKFWIKPIVKKCYLYLDSVITMTITPQNIDFYTNKIGFEFQCHCDPNFLVEKNLARNVGFIEYNCTILKMGVRTLFLDGKNTKRICLVCGLRSVNVSEKCYDYFNEPYNITIYPQSLIYRYQMPLNITCKLSPQSICDKMGEVLITYSNGSGWHFNHGVYLLYGLNDGSVCIKCGNAFLQEVTKCYLRFDLPISLKIYPDNINYLFKGRSRNITCVVNPQAVIDKGYITDIILNSDVPVERIDLLRIIVTPTCDTDVTFICSNYQIDSAIITFKCLEIYPTFRVLPAVTIYSLNRIMVIHCDVYPTELAQPKTGLQGMEFHFNGTQLDKLNYTLTGIDLGYLCFECGHPLLYFDNRCYSFLNEIVRLDIRPDIEYFDASKLTNFTCVILPKRAAQDYTINTTKLRSTDVGNTCDGRISFCEVTNVSIRSSYTFQCSFSDFDTVTRKYTPFTQSPDFRIEPSDVYLYQKNVPLTIVCFIMPNIYQGRLSRMKFSLNDVKLPNFTKYLDGTDQGKLNFQCGHPELFFVYQSFTFIGDPISVKIIPDSKYYFSPVSTIVRCNTSPKIIMEQNLMSGLHGYGDNAKKLDNWSAVIPVGSVVNIDFMCGKSGIAQTSRTYYFMDQLPKFEIQPNYTKVYVINRVMNVSCNVKPDILTNTMNEMEYSINGLKINGYFMILNGDDKGKLCFKCGHPLYGFDNRCYEYLKMPINISIEPNNINYYFKSKPLNVSCVVTPEIVVKGKYLSDLKMEVNSTEVVKIHSLNYMIPDGCTNTVSFTCGSTFTSHVEKVYKYFEITPRFYVQPNYTKIYMINAVMDVTCEVEPVELMGRLQGMELWVNSVKLSSLTMTLDGVNRGKMCFKCGHPTLYFDDRCYTFLNDTITIAIDPGNINYYFNTKPTNIRCIVLPAIVVSEKLLTDLTLAANSTNVINKNSLWCEIPSGTTGDITFLCDSAFIKRVQKIYKFGGQTPRFHIQPNTTKIYLLNHQINVTCNVDPDTLTKRLEGLEFFLNGTKLPDLSSTIGIVNKGLLCFKCGHPVLHYDTRCYNFYPYDVTFNIYPDDTDIYILNETMVISCDVQPEEILSQDLVQNITFTYNNSTFPLSGLREITIIGKRLGKICFQCGHLIGIYSTRCYEYSDPFVRLTIQPREFEIYFKKKTFNVSCELPTTGFVDYDINITIDLKMTTNTSGLIKVSDLVYTITGIDLGTICFTCGNTMIPNVTRCYTYCDFYIDVEILPNDTKIYFPNKTMYISCIFIPVELTNNSKLKGVGFIFNNSTMNRTFLRRIKFDGRNDGTICFTCGHIIFNVFTRCYRYYDKPISLVIEPEYKRFYIHNLFMNVRCSSDPLEIIKDKLILRIGFTFNNSTFPLINEREIHVYGKNVRTICFRCEHRLLNSRSRCYEHYDYKITFHVYPDYEIYIPNVPMNVYCSSEPPSSLYLIDNILFTQTNASILYRTDAFIRTDDTNTKTICFQCGIQNFSLTTRCYEAYNRPVRLTILPNDLKIYFKNLIYNVTCHVYPDDVIEKIPDIELTADFQYPLIKLPRTIEMPQSDQGTICFTCSNPIITRVRHCYKYYNHEINLRVIPDNINIYFVNFTLKITCTIDPIELIYENLIGIIELRYINSTMGSDDPYSFTIYGVNRGTMCFICVNAYIVSKIKCYSFYKGKFNLRIKPETKIIFYKDSFFQVWCEIEPVNNVTNGLLSGIDFKVMNGTHDVDSLGNREILIYPKNVSKTCLKCSHVLFASVTRCYIFTPKFSFRWHRSFKNVYLTSDFAGCIYPNIFQGFVTVEKLFGPGQLNTSNSQNFSTFTNVGGIYRIACKIEYHDNHKSLAYKIRRMHQIFKRSFECIVNTFEIFYMPTYICVLPSTSNPGGIIWYGHNGYPEDQANYHVSLYSNNKLYASNTRNYVKIPYNLQSSTYTVIFRVSFFIGNDIRKLEKTETDRITLEISQIMAFTKEDVFCASQIAFSYENLQQLSNTTFMSEDSITRLVYPNDSRAYIKIIIWFFVFNLLTLLSFVFIHKFIDIKPARSVKHCIKLRYLNATLTDLSNKFLYKLRVYKDPYFFVHRI